MRVSLDQATRPEGQLKFGSALVKALRPASGVDLKIERDRSPAVPCSALEPRQAANNRQAQVPRLPRP